MFINPKKLSRTPNQPLPLILVNPYITGFILSFINTPSHISAPIHIARHTFASIGFDNDPYEGTFSFNCSGNNQYTCLIRVFTSKEAWDTYSKQCEAITYDEAGIENVMIDLPAGDNVKYNLKGQRVNNPTGFYIMNGKVHYTAE